MRLVRYRVGEACPSREVISDGTIMDMPVAATSRVSIRPLTIRGLLDDYDIDSARKVLEGFGTRRVGVGS